MGSSNPIKSVTKAVKKAVKQTSREVSRTGDTLSKVGTAVAGAAQDPGAWMGYLASPIAGQDIGSEAAVENYQALNQAEKDKARAEGGARMEGAKQKKAQLKQEKMVADKAKCEAAKAKERATRLGQGRRGLLYQGKEAGVSGKSSKLGG